MLNHNRFLYIETNWNPSVNSFFPHSALWCKNITCILLQLLVNTTLWVHIIITIKCHLLLIACYLCKGPFFSLEFPKNLKHCYFFAPSTHTNFCRLWANIFIASSLMQIGNEGWAIALTQDIVNENLPWILAQSLFLLLEFVLHQFESTQNYLLQSLTLCMLWSVLFISSLIHPLSFLVCLCVHVCTSRVHLTPLSPPMYIGIDLLK